MVFSLSLSLSRSFSPSRSLCFPVIMDTKVVGPGAAGPVTCSLCLDTFREPVTIPCGHNFCMGCIRALWDTLEGGKKDIGCPLCRQVFSGRPQLGINHTLVELLEHFQTGGQQNVDPDTPSTPEDILCDFCTEEQTRAARSCLVCLASYCEPHLKPHLKNPVFQRHRLVPPVRHMEEKLCKVHLKPLEGFCRTDQTCICQMCTAQTHKEHEVVTLELEKVQIEEQQPQLLKDVENKMKEIGTSIAQSQQAAQLIKNTALKEKEDLLGVLEKLHEALVSSIESEERSKLSQLKEDLTDLEEKLRKLSLQRQKLEKVPSTDPASFIQTFQDLKTMANDAGVTALSDDEAQSFTELREAKCTVNELIENLVMNREGQAMAGDSAGGHVCLEELSTDSNWKLMAQESNPKHCDSWNQSASMELKSYYLQYAYPVVFDDETAERFLVLTGNEVKRQSNPLDYPENDRRFTDCAQVLGQGLPGMGRYYWEVEILNGYVSFGVSTDPRYPVGFCNSNRLGRNDQSWCLRWDGQCLAAWHKNVETKIQLSYKRIGVFFDGTADPITLSFYVYESSRMRRLHKFNLIFKKSVPDLYPAFYLESVGARLKIRPLTQSDKTGWR